MPSSDPDLAERIEAARQALREAEAQHGEMQRVTSLATARCFEIDRSREEIAATLPPDSDMVDPAEAVAHLEGLERAMLAERDRYQALTAQHKQAQDRLRAAESAVVELHERQRAWELRRNDLARRLADASAVVTPAFGGSLPSDAAPRLQTQLAEVSAKRQAVERLDATRRNVEAKLTEARERRDAVIHQRQQVAEEMARLESATDGVLEGLRRFGEPVLTDEERPAEGKEALEARLAGLRKRADNTRACGEGLAGQARKDLEDARIGLVALAQEEGLAVEGHGAGEISTLLQKTLRDAELALDRGRHRVEELSRQMERREEIEKSMVEGRRRLRLYQKLATALKADHFIRYVLGESMALLAALATTELKKITGERYSMEPREDSFVVVDHFNADESRSVATLSGGETFLASLALALALSSSVRDLAGNAAAARLDSMFIDEGFGALDAETLQVAADALENLAGDSRMIGVISHVPALAERFPDGLDVRKVGVSSTITRR